MKEHLLPEFMLNSISDPVDFIDLDRVIRWSNRTSIREKKAEFKDVVGKSCRTVHGAFCKSCRDCPLEQVFQTRTSMTRESLIALSNNNIQRINTRYYPIFDNSGCLWGAMRIAMDVSGKKPVEDDVKKCPYPPESAKSFSAFDIVNPPAENLSMRERQVLALLADGLSNPQIAETLSISCNTVKTHVVHIFNKMGVNDRTRASVVAARLSMI